MTERLLSVEEILRLPSPEPDARIAYGEDALQFGDLRVPATEGPHAVAVVLHGGCWRSRYDIGHIGSFSDAVTRSGIATWSLEYRRVGNPGGGWPGTFLDVARGLDHLRRLAASYPLDLARVIAVGHSAGGHLALWLAARAKLPSESPVRGGADPLPLKGVVSLAGVDDLRRALREGICDDMAAQLMGGGPEELAARYAEASPVELLPMGVPQRLVNGTFDPIVPVAFGRDFEEQSREAGDDVELTVIEDAGHFEIIAPGTKAFAVVLEAISSLMSR
ncbi:MAG: alpha/beta hydrolase family protein [Vicinamibacteria bacterium]